MDIYDELLKIYNENCEGYTIKPSDILSKDDEGLEDEEYVGCYSISGKFNKVFKTFIFVCSYYPDGYGKADVYIKVFEKGKSYIINKKIKVNAIEQ